MAKPRAPYGSGPSHGTQRRYKLGCRCEECRHGNNAQQLAYYHRRKAANPEWHPSNPKSTPPNCAACGLPLKFANPRGVWHNECRPHKFYASPERRRAIYERDSWTCQLCMEPVDPDAPHRDKWSATLDHIIPRSLGGSNDDENLRLAHLVCNSIRGNGKRVAAMTDYEIHGEAGPELVVPLAAGKKVPDEPPR